MIVFMNIVLINRRYKRFVCMINSEVLTGPCRMKWLTACPVQGSIYSMSPCLRWEQFLKWSEWVGDHGVCTHCLQACQRLANDALIWFLMHIFIYLWRRTTSLQSMTIMFLNHVGVMIGAFLANAWNDAWLTLIFQCYECTHQWLDGLFEVRCWC